VGLDLAVTLERGETEHRSSFDGHDSGDSGGCQHPMGALGVRREGRPTFVQAQGHDPAEVPTLVPDDLHTPMVIRGVVDRQYRSPGGRYPYLLDTPIHPLFPDFAAPYGIRIGYQEHLGIAHSVKGVGRIRGRDGSPVPRRVEP
jgi:hypothetical protein